MRATFDTNVPRVEKRERSAIGDAIAQMATPEAEEAAPIPITRAREQVAPHGWPPVERRTDALRLELAAQLDRAQEAEKRFQRALNRAQGELVTVSEEVQTTLRKLTAAEQQLEQKQNLLKQLLGRMASLDKERQAATSAREALEALKSQYDQYNRARAQRGDDDSDSDPTFYNRQGA